MKPALTHPAQLVVGPLIWSLWFVSIYAGLSLACALAPPTDQGLSWINAALLLFTLATVLLLGGLFVACCRAARASTGQPALIGWVAASVHLVSAITALFIALPGLMLPPCL